MIAGEPAPLVVLRVGRADDAELLRAWRNEPTAVRFSGTARTVSRLEHRRWLDARLTDPATHLWIAEEANTPVGHVRVDVKDGTGLVSIVVDAGARGRGLGSAILRAMLAVINADLAVNRLIALAHPENTGSLRSFERVGFSRRRQSDDRGFVVLEWAPEREAPVQATPAQARPAG